MTHFRSGSSSFIFPHEERPDNLEVLASLGLAGTSSRKAIRFMPLLSQTSVDWVVVLDQLSNWSTAVIVICFGLHLLLFLGLWGLSRRDFRVIASTLFDFTRGMKHQSLFDSAAHLGDQIEGFLADVNDVLDDPTRRDDRQMLLTRMQYLDEKRRYLQSMFFDTLYNMARTMIEAYPLAGVLGTMLAIGAALTMGSDDPGNAVALVVNRFGQAIWSSFAGLISAIILMLINSFLEPSFNRLSEDRRLVRETVARAKRILSLAVHKSEGPDA